jgi:Zn-dependent M32 family carboxypeptidase
MAAGLQAYAKVATKLKETSALEGINGLLGWDEMTMCPDGAQSSGMQLPSMH